MILAHAQFNIFNVKRFVMCCLELKLHLSGDYCYKVTKRHKWVWSACIVNKTIFEFHNWLTDVNRWFVFSHIPLLSPLPVEVLMHWNLLPSHTLYTWTCVSGGICMWNYFSRGHHRISTPIYSTVLKPLFVKEFV